MEIKGLRSRVTIGFMSIAGLLFLSGMLSFFELNTLSEDTDAILSTNKRNMEFSQSMLKSLQAQNYAFVQIVAFGDRSLDSICLANVGSLERCIKDAKAKSEVGSRGLLDSMLYTSSLLRVVTERLISIPVMDFTSLVTPTSLDSLAAYNDRDLYQDYQPLYNSMLSAIDQYINHSQDALAPRAESLHHNAYRAVTPVFISLVVMIVIVLLLYYFMLLYCVNPIISMNKSLFDYISYKIPFAPKGECRDEMLELKEKIEHLIKASKRQNS